MTTSYPTGSNSASDSSEISSQLNTGSFDIRDHLDKLQPGKGKNKYICPVCSGRNLSVVSKTGKYHCFTSDCATTDIREAIKPWAEVLAEREAEKEKQKPQKKVVAVKSVSKQSVQIPIPTGLKLLRLLAPQYGPEPHKPQYIPDKVPAEAEQVTYAYSPSQEVFRYQWIDLTLPKGRDKTYRQTRIADDGKRLWTKGDLPWPAYRIEEVVETLKGIPDDKPVAVLMLEGEPNVELARSHGIAGLTLQGSNWNDAEITRAVEALRATGKNITLLKLRDNDATGIKKGAQVQSICDHLQFPCIVIDPVAIYPDIPDKGDIREILENMDIEEFICRLEAEIHNAAMEEIQENSLTSHAHTREDVVRLSSNCSSNDYIPDTAPTPELNYVQKAESALYSDGHWVSIAGQIYRFTDGYYQLRSEPSEKRRIRDWLSTHSENVKGLYRCNRANSGSVNQVYDWMVLGLAVDIEAVNPPGLNCSNGVLKINSDGSHTITPHDPKQVYTYIGGKYDPDIDATDCDRLLECLEPQQREIFLRTIAAALCLPLARLKMSRVKGLLCHGDGSNGKDTLRTALVAVLGRGVTGKSLKDFQVYDSGRKFPLAGLENSLCNWSSENADAVKLDKLQSLKQFITGDELTIEHKGRGEYPYKPEAIFLANCNVLPSISSDAEAIRSRYCILSFKKTYVVGADSGKGELEADPRFKENPDFILERIAPALLNRMLERIPLLLTQGINYGSSDAALREAQEKSQHLWQFVRDSGIEVQSGGRIYVKDLWEHLQEWYQEVGILEIEGNEDKKKLVWNDLPNRYDTPVKAVNQVYARLCEIFPKLQKQRDEGRTDSDRRGQSYLSGIGFLQQSEKSAKTALAALAVNTEKVTGLASALANKTANALANALANAQTLTESDANAANAVSPTILEICNLLSKLTDDERQKLAEILTQPQPEQPTPPTQPKRVTLKKGVRVRYVGDNANCVAQYGKLDLVVDEVDKYGEVACLKPDGSFTTWLNSQDLRAIPD
ncbi:MAG: helicase superfamily 3 [Oscillatoriales cyanobacterium]|nr:MAG: helicase superfamily 3 [Oscillatoriales cyanobacterium]TAH24192.1 MAG: helicase superfamily 3 [Oscillatoriales cyanobacterium]